MPLTEGRERFGGATGGGCLAGGNPRLCRLPGATFGRKAIPRSPLSPPLTRGPDWGIFYARCGPGCADCGGGAGGINPSPTNGFYARRRPGGCAHKQNKAGAFQDGRRRSFLYIQLFRTGPRKFARGRTSLCRGEQADISRRSVQIRTGACGQRRNRRPVSSASTVRVSPGAWLPAMISLAIIVSTCAWIYRLSGRAP